MSSGFLLPSRSSANRIFYRPSSARTFSDIARLQLRWQLAAFSARRRHASRVFASRHRALSHFENNKKKTKKCTRAHASASQNCCRCFRVFASTTRRPTRQPFFSSAYRRWCVGEREYKISRYIGFQAIVNSDVYRTRVLSRVFGAQI